MTIYKPAEDSYLMSRILKQRLTSLLKQNPDLKFLEIGAGSGIHLETAFKEGVKKENIFSVDIDLSSVNHCTSLGFNCVHSDLFEKVKGKFDLIIFNPPYLPRDKDEPEDSQIQTTGGEKGNEVIIRFLTDAKNYLNPQGRIFLITSNLAEVINFEKLGFIEKEIGCENLFFERLCIWELKTTL